MGTVDFCFVVQNYIRASKQRNFAIMSAADVAAVAVEAKDKVKEIVKEVENLSLAEEPKEEAEKPETNATDEESPKEEEKKVEEEKKEVEKKDEEKVEEKTEETPAE